MAAAEKTCDICKFSDTDELNYGPWKTSEDITVHYFCALLSTHSVQRGEDDEGIDGFLPKDIRDLIKLHKNKKCYYCKKPGASIRCVAMKCTIYFHLVCGVKKNCLSIFEDKFISYCHRHVDIKEQFAIHEDWWKCQICEEAMGPYDPLMSIPSCCDTGYYHKRCMQMNAITAGYLMKCPSCAKYPSDYRKFLANRGIFCPDKDADWEMDKSAFKSLLYVYKQCDAETCKCPKGRSYAGLPGRWQLFKCDFCGSKGRHTGCREDGGNGKFICSICIHDPIYINSQEVVNNNNQPSGLKATNETVLVREPQRNSSMRDDRMRMFFESANFASKPQPPTWLV